MKPGALNAITKDEVLHRMPQSLVVLFSWGILRLSHLKSQHNTWLVREKKDSNILKKIIIFLEWILSLLRQMI